MLTGMDTTHERVLPMARIFHGESPTYAEPVDAVLKTCEDKPGPFCHYFKSKDIAFEA
ncbi:hypothetical protein [Desulfovibrio inopinatus]|uniref:hypothetical protein n=1 Tax=Desulfovibrio inopinatus TaxID=102109 RepID=UPI00041043A6|nr:hypothetical protein [Desulfovibrio inopinatus]